MTLKLELYFLSILFFLTIVPAKADETASVRMILKDWEANTGSGFVKCGPHPWNWPPEYGGTGAEGYTGYGYYRTKVVIPSFLRGTQLALFFCGIDDADVTFFNECAIGSAGSFPVSGTADDGYISAWRSPRLYPVPESIVIYDGPNFIDVKVFF